MCYNVTWTVKEEVKGKKKKEVKENGDLRSTAAVTMLSCEDSLGSVIV